MRPRLYLPGRWLALFSLLTLAVKAIAQDSAVLTNLGDPLRVGYTCPEEDLQWAGMACTEEDPCPIYLELSSISPNGRKIFLGGNLHSTSATLGSVLLMSEDGGTTWKEPAARIRGAAIDQTQFYNLQAGWAAGETQYPLARDPFFLITTDGGSSWRQSPVGEDGLVGAVVRFSFDSAQHGELIVDAGKASAGGRYLSFETEVGGSGWTLHGKSNQLPKQKQVENPDWRIRSSKDGKTFEIEERSGSAWKSLASFLIDVANCKASVDDLREPGPPK
jgi:hypothetical protein